MESLMKTDVHIMSGERQLRLKARKQPEVGQTWGVCVLWCTSTKASKAFRYCNINIPAGYRCLHRKWGGENRRDWLSPVDLKVLSALGFLHWNNITDENYHIHLWCSLRKSVYNIQIVWNINKISSQILPFFK